MAFKIDDVTVRMSAFGPGFLAQDLDNDPAFAERLEAKKVVGFAATNIGKVDQLLSDLAKGVEEINRSRDFTAPGKANALGRLGNDMFRRLDALSIDKYLGAARERLAFETERLSEGRTHDSLSLQDRLAVGNELRRRYNLDTDPFNLRSLVSDAIAEGDDLIPDAVLNVPRSLRLEGLTDENHATLLAEWQASRSPLQARVVQSLTTAIKAVEEHVRVAREEIASGTGTGDPLVARAAGAA